MMDTTDLAAQLSNRIVNNRYHITGNPRLGDFAYIYEAEDLIEERRVALKIFKEQQDQENYWRQKFDAEARSIINHPNVVEILEHGVDDEYNLPFIVMEWIDGPTLADWLNDTYTRDIRLLLKIALQIAKGLAAIHASGMTHNNITPSNILLAQDNGDYVPKLCDFGFAEAMSDGTVKSSTIKYAAPERLTKSERLSTDPRSDIYSLGAVLYELFTHRYYLDNVSESDLRDAIREPQPRTLFEMGQVDIPELDALLQHMLQKNPSERPPLTSVVERLEAILTEREQGFSLSLPPTASTVELEPFIDFSVQLYLTSAAANRIRRHILPKLLTESECANLPDDDQELVYQLFRRGSPYECYLYNAGKENVDSLIEVRLATDSNQEENVRLAKELGGTLVLDCKKTSRPNLLVSQVWIESKSGYEYGYRAPNGLPVRFTFHARYEPNPASDSAIRALADRVAALPENSQPNPDVQAKLKHWRAYLKFWKRLAEEKMYRVAYSQWREVGDLVWFYLDDKQEIPWEKIDKTRDDQLRLLLPSGSFTDDDLMEGNYDTVYIGDLKKIDRSGKRLAIALDDDFRDRHRDPQTDLLDIQAPGVLIYEAIGDLAQIQQQERALTRLETGSTPNPRLNRFIFDAGRAALPNPEHERITIDEADILLSAQTGHALNKRQLQAVEGALNAPDLYLIQGPPGTGKTTVIAELCYQFTRRGQRVLVSSQSNLAVDNALSKLAHHPNILALRVGNADRVEPEGEPFVEEQVVATWFKRTAEDCRSQLQIIEHDFEQFEELVQGYQRLSNYINLKQNYDRQSLCFQKEYKERVQKREEHESALAEIESEQTALRSYRERLQDIDSLLSQQLLPENDRIPNWRSPALNLYNIEPYRNYVAYLAEGVKLLGELGVVQVKELLNTHLNHYERSLLQQLGEDRNAELTPHRVGMFLYLGLIVHDLLRNSTESVEVEDVKELSVLVSRYQKARAMLARVEAVTEADENARKLRELLSGLRDVTDGHAMFMALAAVQQEKEQQYLRTKKQYEKLVEEQHTLDVLLAKEPQVESGLASVQHKREALSHRYSKLQECNDNLARAEEVLALRRTDVTVKKQAVEIQKELIASYNSFATNLEQQYLPGIEQWLRGEIATLPTNLPTPIADALKAHTWSAEEDETLRSLKAACEETQRMIAECEQILGRSRDELPSGRSSDKELRRHLYSLFQQDENDERLFWPNHPPELSARIRAAVGSRLDFAANAGWLRRLWRKRDPRVETYKLLVSFDLWLRQQVQYHRSRAFNDMLSKGEPRDVVLNAVSNLISAAQNELARLEHEYQEAAQRYDEKRKRLQQPLEEERDSLISQINKSVAELQNFLQQIDDVLQINLTEDLQTIVSTAQLDSSIGQPDLQSLLAFLQALPDRVREHQQSLKRRVSKHRQKLQRAENDLHANRDEVETATDSLDKQRAVVEQAISKAMELLSAYQPSSAANPGKEEILSERLMLMEEVLKGGADENLLLLDQPLNELEQLLGEQQVFIEEQLYELSKLSGQEAKIDQLGQYQEALREEITTCGQRAIERMRIIAAAFPASEIPPIELTNSALHAWRQFIDNVEKLRGRSLILCNNVSPRLMIELLCQRFEKNEEQLEHKKSRHRKEIEAVQAQIDQKRARITQLENDFKSETEWWQSAQRAIPHHLLQDIQQHHPRDSVAYLTEIVTAIETDSSWQQELARQKRLLPMKQMLLQDWISRLETPTDEDVKSLRQLYIENANVIGVTCGQVRRLDKYQQVRPFDVVIVDEVSKATPPELLLPMLKGNKVILVGDHKQLPPLIADNSLVEVAEDLGINPAELAHLEEPLFGTLWDSAPNEIKVMLNEQYRMRPPIMAAINQFYNGELRGGENVPEHGLSFENVGPDTSIVWIETPNTKPFYEKGDMSKYNDEEIKIIKRLLAQMNASWVNSGAERKKQVGIITFYRSQLSRIREEIRPEDYPALVLRRGTVDQFQGMEQEVVIVSLVRNNGDHNIGFAKKPERINVAFSRAQQLLVIVGCRQLFTSQGRNMMAAARYYQNIVDVIAKEGKLLPCY